MNQEEYYTHLKSANEHLEHHGILGQRWGIRRFQNKDGSLTAAGLKRYNKYYDKYIDAGLSKKEALEASKKRSELSKKLAIGVGLVAGTTLTYKAARLIGRNYIDTVIKSGTKMQTLSSNPKYIVYGKQFFSSIKSVDKATYGTLFSLDTHKKGFPSLKKKVISEVGESYKRASRHSATKIYNELKKNNSEFADALNASNMRYYESHRGELFKLLDRVRPSKSEYDSFNRIVLNTSGDKSGDKARQMFYDEMKRKGYGAVVDVNDAFYSGFDTDATINFAKDHIKSYTISDLKKSDIVKNGALFTANLFVRNPIVATLAADTARRSGLKIYDKKVEKKDRS